MSQTLKTAFSNIGVYRQHVEKLLTCAKNQVSASTLSQPVVNYTLEEVQVSKIHGHFAGKLWKAESVPGFTKQYSPIVCLHGWLDNCSSFDPLIPLIIKPGMRILSLDHPGHGYSSHTSGTHYDTVVDGYYGLIKTMQQFNWPKVTVLGHSMGAIVGYTFSGLFPECVDRFIAIDHLRPMPATWRLTELRKEADALLGVERKLGQKLPRPSFTYEEILQKMYLDRGKSINLEGCKILLKRGASKQPDGRYSFNHDLRVMLSVALPKLSDAQTLEIGAAIRCPVCVIKGEPGNDHRLIEDFQRVVNHLKKTAPLVEFHKVQGTHHFHLNSPELVAPIISNFLEI